MAVPNPYLIYINLFWPDGTRPNQNQIARVRAYDVNGSAVTWEGESGFNPSTGGWFPIYMQNIAAFSPPRDQPNLKFEVWNTAEQLVYTTQVFSAIPSSSTVKIIIGVSASIDSGSGTTWLVSGTVRHQDNSLLTAGSVKVLDITAGSEKVLATATLGASGTYTVGYNTSDFTSNGGSHASPNLWVRVYSTGGDLLAQTGPVVGTTNQVINMTVPNDTGTGGDTQRRVFGTVKNELGLAVAGILIEAYHVAWTIQGIQELPLGPVGPGVAADGAGKYEILYDAPVVATPANPCGTPVGQVNLIVYAKEPNGSGGFNTLFTSEVIFDAPAEQEVDPIVDKVAVSTDSEYKRIDDAISACLGDTVTAKYDTLNTLDQRPEYLAFVAQTTGVNPTLLSAYVHAWLIAGAINDKVPASALSRPMSPEVIYALLRILEASSLGELLNVLPDAFFDAIVRAVHEGIVGSALEKALYPDPAFGNLSLLDDWRTVLAKLMNQAGLAWQAQLLSLVFPDSTQFPSVPVTPTIQAFASATAHAVNLPSPIQAGDLLLILFTVGAAASVTVTTPAGYSVVVNQTAGTTTPVRFCVYAKKADGTETGSVNLVTTSAAQATAQVYRILAGTWRGGDVSVPTGDSLTMTATPSNSGTSVDPPSVTVPAGTSPWGVTSKTLWLACAGHAPSPNLTASPTGYTPSPAARISSGSSAGNCTTLSSRHENAVGTENPTAFTLATAASSVAVTLGIREGIVSQAQKREAVVKAHFDQQGSFDDLVASLLANGTLSAGQAENLVFVFELYERVGNYYPIVAAVYNHKAAQGWHTVEDLAKVPLDTGGAGNDWNAYALESESYSSGTFPADVPGDNPGQQARVYAARLYDLFRAAGPQQRFTSDLGAAAGSDTTLQQIATFLAANPDFDLDRTDVDQWAADHPGSLTADAIDRLKQLQRVYRLTSDYAAATALLNNGFDSAIKIARLPEDQFIASQEEFVGGLTRARNIYRTAAHYASEVTFTLVKFHQNINDVGGLTAVPGALMPNLLPAGALTEGGNHDTRQFPNWITLFGNLNQCACKECQTVLGPGAYFVDLLQFVDGAPKRTLFERRADLEDMEITCANTNTTLPYIDLVNEVLEAVVTPLAFGLTLAPDVPTVLTAAVAGDPAALAAVAGAFATETTTKQRYVLTERAVVVTAAADNPPSYREWSLEDDGWRFSIRQVSGGFTVYPSPQTNPNNDSLAVFPEHFNELAYATLAQAVFPFNLPLELGREETEVFLRAKNVAESQILEAFSVADPTSKLVDPAIARAYLRMTDAEANAVFAQGHLTREFWGFTSDTATIPRPDQPTVTETGNYVDLLALVPVFLHRSGLRYQDLLELLDTEFIHLEAPSGGVHLDAPSAALLDCSINDFQLVNLNEATLKRISVFVRLWRRLGWTMRELDRYLMQIHAGELLARDGSNAASLPETLVRLFDLKRLGDEFKLPPRAVVALFRPLDTRRTDRNPRSLFDDVFLVGSPSQPEIQALDSVARGNTLSLDTLTPDTDVKAHVRAALRLKSDDIDRLWSEFVGTGSGLTLNVEKLTNVFRVATVAHSLGIAVSEYDDLATLVGPLLAVGTVATTGLHDAILATHAALREIRTARKTKLTAAEMLYYLTNAHEADDPFVPSAQSLDDAAKRLADASGTIAAGNPEEQNPDAVVLATALGKVMPAEKVVQATQLIESPDPASTTQAAFVTRYFGAFAGPDAVAFLTALKNAAPPNPPADITDEQRIPARYASVWKSLHAYLIDQARTTTAFAVAAELFGTSPDTVNQLLTESLHSVVTPSAPALDDWKKMLEGGWDSGEQVIDAGANSKRSSTFVPSKGGDYRFVVTVSAGGGGAVQFQLDGATPAVESSTATETVYGPVSLKAATAHAIVLDATALAGTTKVTLDYRVGNDDPALLPSTLVVPFNLDAYTKLFKAVRLATSLALTPVELRYVVENPSVFNLDLLPLKVSDAVMAWSKLADLIELVTLNRSVALKTGTLFEFFRDTVPTYVGMSDSDVLAAVAVLTNWKGEDIAAVRGLFAPAPAWDDPALWYVLRDCFALIARLDIRASQILTLLVQAAPTIGSATLLRNIFRAQFSADAWQDVFKPLRDPLRQRQRDALVGYLTTRPLPVGPNGSAVNFIDANDLFAFFLIDVEMEPDTLISRLKLALNVVQLFVQRVFLGLEDPDSLGELDLKKDQWTWMEKFRVWEANRKIFLYPENWIEPELRDDKTEFFRELEDELSQNPLTHDNAMAALATYLEKMSEVSNLEIVGSFAEGNPGDGTNALLHLIGRSRARSRSIFYRTFQGRQSHDGFFSPWTRVDLEIDADVIVPIVVNGKLRLIWPQVLTKEKPIEHDVATQGAVSGSNADDFKSEKRKQYQAEIRLMSSEYNAKKNKWAKAKLTKSRGIDNQAPTPFTQDIGEDRARTANYHLRLMPSSEYLSVDLIKTNIPATAGSLDPVRLGTFQLWFSGDDSFVATGDDLAFGTNWPIGTLLESNAAVETDLVIDSTVSDDTFTFDGSYAFLARTPGTFRVVNVNLSYFGEENQPFFYETLTKSLFAINQGRQPITGMSNQTTLSARFATFHHPLVQVFQEKLNHFGLTGLMHRLTEALPVADDRYYGNYYYNYYYGSLYLGYHIAGDARALYTTQRMFEEEHEPNADAVAPLYPLPTVEFGYGTSFGIYNWELFFHIPMLIAERMTQDLQFEEALGWYHSVFDPRQDLNKYEQTQRWVDALPVGSRYWTFLPFFANKDTTDSLLATLGLTKTLSAYDHDQLSALIDAWRQNPFNPHLIARQRIAAYQKFVVMKYLDNLIAWADQLFRQDTFETINEATQLYILADQLLGQKPDQIDPVTSEPRLTYRDLAIKGIDDFSEAIVDVESLIQSAKPHLKDVELPPLGSGINAVQNIALKSFYFCIPRNERLDGYWDTVKDRLFKIRNSMNIDGVKRQLALFEPPIDPGLLVRAAAAGLDIGSVLAALNAPLPCYRFNVWIQKATELCKEVQAFGGALLAALEKKDSEALQLLRQTQEITLLKLVTRVREQQVKEAEENITALELSRALAEERHQYYASRVKISTGEAVQLSLTTASTVIETTQGILHGTAGLFGAVPDSNVGMVGPFPAMLAALKIGTAGTTIATQAADALGAVASLTRGLANIAGMVAGYERRWDDWKLQERLAIKEIDQLNQQIVVAQIRLDIAEKELENHEQQLENSEDLLEFLQDKFTSRDLYQWMVTQLSRTYNQVYKLAFDAARTAERTYQFELGVSDSFIQFDYIDSLHQGLLAGEKLIYDIKRMDVAYLERHKRELEIQKPISLMGFDAKALQDLRENGSCTFELPETLFDLDFPGQYFRRVKGVRLTIPCVTGPNTSVSATLSLLGSAYRKDSAASGDGVAYAYQGVDDPRFVHDPVGITSIATSRAQGDPGLFEFNFRDERYLPFEGAGAVSRWRLELPDRYRQFDYNTISDVVLEMSYTARDGGGLLKQGAEEAIIAGLNSIRELATNGPADNTGLVRVFSMKREFPDALHRLLSAADKTATFKILPEHFPFVIRDARLKLELIATASNPSPIDVHVIPKFGKDLPNDGSLELDGKGSQSVAPPNGKSVGIATLTKNLPTLVDGGAAEDWTLVAQNLDATSVDDIALIATYSVSA